MKTTKCNYEFLYTRESFFQKQTTDINLLYEYIVILIRFFKNID